MKKLLSNILLSILSLALTVTCMPMVALAADGYTVTPVLDGITYVNNELGFSLTLPASWKDKYSVLDGSQAALFLHAASRNKAGTSEGTLFSIIRYEGNGLSEGALEGAGERHLAAQTDMFYYVLAYPSGVEYTDETEAEYEKMTADIAAILKTVKAIPITDMADPTYSAIGKLADNGLTDNYLYTFAKGAKDAAPGDCLLMINGQFTDWPVIIRNNCALVPLSAAQEALNIHIFWDRKESIELTGTNNNEIKMRLGQTQATVNGKMITLGTAPIAANGTVYLPIRFLCDYLGKSVGYLPAGARVSAQYLTSASDQKTAKGLAYNPIVWVDDSEKTNNGKPTDETLTWLQEQMRQGLANLKDNIDTANRGYLKGTKPDDPTFLQIETAIDNSYYIGNVGRYAMFQSHYITLVDIETKTIYFYTIAHQLGAIWKADMSNPDIFVPMYFAD